MSTRHCKNATSFQMKRLVRCQTKEQFTDDGAINVSQQVENNLNLVGHEDASGAPNFYAGRDHLPTDAVQRSTPA